MCISYHIISKRTELKFYTLIDLICKNNVCKMFETFTSFHRILTKFPKNS